MKKVFKFVIMVILFALSFMLIINAEIYSGECGLEGDNVVWTLDTETGVLEITGVGAMKNYRGVIYNPDHLLISGGNSPGNSPWSIGCVKKVIIGDGVTTIGTWAFWECWYLKEVILGDDITFIGEGAFLNAKLWSI